MNASVAAWFAQPDLAVAFVVVGILLIYLEFNIPGKVVAGATGMLLAMLGIFGLTQLPVYPPALALLVVGMFPLPAAIAAGPRLAVLLTALGAGGLIFCLKQLVTTTPNGLGGVHLLTAVVAGTALPAATVWLGRIALLARRNKRVLVPAGNPGRNAPMNAGPAPLADPAE